MNLHHGIRALTTAGHQSLIEPGAPISLDELEPVLVDVPLFDLEEAGA